MFELHNMRMIEGLKKNIIYIGALMEDGWRLVEINNKDSIHLKHNQMVLRFVYKENNLFSVGARLISKDEICNVNLSADTNKVWTTAVSKNQKKKAHLKIEKPKIIKDINRYHDEYGHRSVRCLRMTARMNGVELIGELKPCDSCAVHKIKATKVKRGLGAIP